jgi:hypothetical protein
MDLFVAKDKDSGRRVLTNPTHANSNNTRCSNPAKLKQSEAPGGRLIKSERKQTTASCKLLLAHCRHR